MKKIIALAVMMILVVVAVAFGADAVAVTPATKPDSFNAVMTWMKDHQVVLGMLLIGIIDFICAINPQWANNGAVHLVYLFAQKLAGVTPSNNNNNPPA